MANREKDRVRLQAWLTEWRIEQALRKAWYDDVPGRPPQRDGAPMACRKRGGTGGGIRPSVGEVWLLPPYPCGHIAERPLYVLIDSCTRDGLCRVIPFGPFATPAVPGEWTTALRPAPLRVLCMWNARTFPSAALARGWKSAVLPRRVMDSIRRVQEDPGEPARVPRVAAARRGPPLIHPADPRWHYLAEEASLLEDSRQVAMDALDSVIPHGGDATGDWSPRTLARAAEARGTYRTRRSRHRRGRK